MNSFYYTFLKHKELILYIILFLTHVFFAPIYKSMGLEYLFIYDTLISFVYGIFILLFKNNHRSLFLNFAFIEILVYSIFITIYTGTDFGSILFALCCIPCFFFFAYSTQRSRKNHIILSVTAALATLFIIWWKLGREGSFFSAYLVAVTTYKSFYKIKVIISSILALFFMFYLIFSTQKDLFRSEQKTKKHAQELEFMAHHDPLTGLKNRRKILDLINHSTALKELGGSNYTLCIFDIDNFKHVNDTWGHDAGDFILTRISNLVSEMSGPGSYVARWGGEEFLILFTYHDNTIPQRLEKIRAVVEACPNLWNGTNISVTLTMGVSSSKTGLNPDKIIIEADNSLYYGKTHGKNQVCLSDTF